MTRINVKIDTINCPGSAANTPGYGQPIWIRLTVSILSLETDKYYLGSLCLKGHDYNGTGNSLRYKLKGTCVICAKDRSKRQKNDNPEKYKEYQQEYHRQNWACIRQQQKLYRELNKEEINRKKLEAQKKDRLSANQRNRKYQSSERGKVVKAQNSRRRYARKKNVHQADYTPEQTINLRAKFNGCCAYCGKAKLTELDHFIPISQGGSNCLGNLIPACRQCNPSKSDSDPSSWYKSQPFYSVKRWRHILKALGKTDANYTQLPLF